MRCKRGSGHPVMPVTENEAESFVASGTTRTEHALRGLSSFRACFATLQTNRTCNIRLVRQPAQMKREREGSRGREGARHKFSFDSLLLPDRVEDTR